MLFDNETPYPAHLIRGILPKDEMLGSLVVRVTYDVAEIESGGHELLPAAEQVWKTSPGPWEGPRGDMPGDELFYRGGVDLFVFGHARAPGGVPVEQLDVTIQIADKFTSTVRVIGDRVWEKRALGKPVIGAPKPFREMPLDFERAFGGSGEWDQLEISFPTHPNGRGYALDLKSLVGCPLPNLEHPDRLIQRPEDQPEPVGLSVPPIGYGPIAERGIEFDPKSGMMTHLDPLYFNQAFPEWVAPKSVAPGDRLTLTGVREEGPLELFLPEAPVFGRLTFDDKVIEQTPPIDQIGLEPDERRAFVTYRWPFRYRFIPEQKRRFELLPKA